MLAKKSDSESTILEDSAVLAQLISVSLPSVSVLMARCSSMNLHACQTTQPDTSSCSPWQVSHGAYACLFHSNWTTWDNSHSPLATKSLFCCQ